MAHTMAQNLSSHLLLNAGSGMTGRRRMPKLFVGEDWREVRLDVEPRVKPDVVGSVVDVATLFPSGMFDAVWSSHNLEHLYGHEVPIALKGFSSVLKPGGFAIVTCPDLESVAAALIEHGPDHVAYTAAAGPIRVHDMMFGHGPSIASGFTAMAHRSGLTQASLGRMALAAGFSEVRVGRGQAFDLWGLLAMPDCRIEKLRPALDNGDLSFLFADVDVGPQN
jgi:hypothetical protein